MDVWECSLTDTHDLCTHSAQEPRSLSLYDSCLAMLTTSLIVHAVSLSNLQMIIDNAGCIKEIHIFLGMSSWINPVLA